MSAWPSDLFDDEGQQLWGSDSEEGFMANRGQLQAAAPQPNTGTAGRHLAGAVHTGERLEKEKEYENELGRLAEIFRSKTNPSHRHKGYRAPTQRQQEATICVGIYDANGSFGQNHRT